MIFERQDGFPKYRAMIAPSKFCQSRVKTGWKRNRFTRFVAILTARLWGGDHFVLIFRAFLCHATNCDMNAADGQRISILLVEHK